MNTRKDNEGKALKAWKALGPAHIAKPLRHIRNRCVVRDARGRITYKHPYPIAEVYARCGLGDYVTALAFDMR